MWISPVLIAGIILGVILIIALTLFIVSIYLDKNSWNDYSILEILTGVVGCASLLFAAVLIPLGALETNSYNTEYNKFICNLISLRVQSSIEGHFCLGTGSINGKEYYYYGYESSYGFGQDKTEVSKSFIVEDDTKTPSLYHIKEKGLNNDRYIYYVPTGTIKVYYNVN